MTYKNISFTDVQISDPVWMNRLKLHQEKTISACISKCEEERVENFKRAARSDGQFVGRFYDDSDLYKVIEGVAYSLMSVKNKDLEDKMDTIIGYIADAQEENGYLMTYYTLETKEKRWTDMDRHEMYCGGHLIEAAIAYYKSTGKRKLLDVAIKLVDHYMEMFGPDKRFWIPGHQEIELALVKLYEVTKDERYLTFSKWLIDNRGVGKGFDTSEVGAFRHPKFREAYYQCAVPVTELERVTGHAVRAMYLYMGMADLSNYVDNTGYIPALDRVWDHIVYKNMYITGAIGSSKKNEGFTEDYDLPNESAYGETCAGIGFFLWNWRMAQLKGDTKYVDVMERTLYNNILAGWSRSGDEFFYVNPLEANGKHNRQQWFTTACCPTNLCRFIPSIGDYIYGLDQDSETLYVNLFIEGNMCTTVNEQEINVTMKTDYPVSGHVAFKADQSINLALRYPEWCNEAELIVNGKKVGYSVDKGYVMLAYKAGDEVEFVMTMDTQKKKSHPKVKANIGKVALQRGPIVYAMESCDHDKSQYKDINILADDCEGLGEAIYDNLSTVKVFSHDGKEKGTFIPYYQWNNRGEHAMKVWVDEDSQDMLYQ